MIHHYYFTVKGNWRATRARGEKKSYYHLQISHQNFSKPSAAHNAATLTVALPKLWAHFSNVQMLIFREDAGKHWQSTVSWRLLTSLSPQVLAETLLFHFQWMQTLRQKLVKLQCIYCRYICYSPHSVTALHGSRSSPTPKEITVSSGVSRARREQSNRT